MGSRRLWLSLAAGLAAALLLTSVGAGVFWRLWSSASPRDGAATVQRVRIDPGMTLTAAADTLSRRGLLAHRQVFLIGARLTGRERDLRAGLYEIPTTSSPRDLLTLLTSGATVQVKLTVPEGLNVEEVAALVSEGLGVVADDFVARADSLARAAIVRSSTGRTLGRPAQLDSLIVGSSSGPGRILHWCEGYLAPDTYQFSEGVSARRVAEVLVGTQLARIDSALNIATTATDSAAAGVAQRLELDGHELLTLASIVEAEARIDHERPLIAAVYVNRLRRGWRLEADPTVAFFLNKKGKRLYYKDLQRTSPYNTYRRSGLPPGPIGNPGLAALLAAARPDTTCRALYFVSDGQGGHVFSRTAEEHREAVARFRRERRRQGG